MSTWGFTYGRTDDGGFWLRSHDGRFKRVHPDLLAVLLELGHQSARTPDDGEMARAIASLKRDGFVRRGQQPTKHERPPDIRLGLRLVLFVALFGMLAGLAWKSLAVAVQVRDPWAHLWVLPFFALLAVLHELGHYLAARPYFRPRIGFGLLNGLFPAIVTHTNDAWTCPRNIRIWINLAGPMVDLVAGCAVGVLHLAFWQDDPVLASCIVVQWLRVVFVLNPLIEGDGYWCLCDGLGITNLRTRGLADLKALRLSRASGYTLASFACLAASLLVASLWGYRMLGL